MVNQSGVVSTKTPPSIVLCVKNISLPKECNRMVKYQNGKVYKLLTKIRASLHVLCNLTSLLWSWRWAKSSWNVLGKIMFAGSRIYMTCNDCFNAFQTVMGQKCSWNRIKFISRQWRGSSAKILNLFKLYALILLYKEAIDHWLQSCTGAMNRSFARWCHFTTTTRILFVFCFVFKFCNPTEV